MPIYSCSRRLSTDMAKELNMDHIYVKFADFLWAYTFIGPFSYLAWLRGTTVLRFQKFLHKIGIINPKCDYETLAATLLLEQTQAINYVSTASDGYNVLAGFFFPDFPYVDNKCVMQVAQLFTVHIDLEKKKFVKAKIDNESLTAEEAATVTLLWYNNIAAQHVKLHEMANWGLNTDDSLQSTNPFLRRNSDEYITFC